jgi:integrase
MATEMHTAMGGKVRLYRRGGGDRWHCSTFLNGKKHRKGTDQDSLALAKEFAEDWYLTLRGKHRAGLLKSEKTFAEAAEQFLKEYGVITEGQRSERWTEGHQIRLRLHLLPFFGALGLSEVTAGKVQDYRMHRATTAPEGSKRAPRLDAEGKPLAHKAPARSTIHDEVVTLRQVLKTAIRRAWLAYLPDLSPPYRTQGKITHRPWFAPEEYKALYTATRQHAHQQVRARDRWNAEQLHDYVLFMANTGLRPDEAKETNLQHRDVKMVKDQETGELILEIEVRGKRGVGYCKSMPNAVKPYQRLMNRPKWAPQGRAPRSRKAEAAHVPAALQKPEATDPVFPGNHIKLFNRILDGSGLKDDREGNPRTAYSLRHTYICMRLMEGADVYQIAKNCRTSVEMIEKFYAAHLKHTLDASAINTRRRRRRPALEEGRAD